MKHARISAADVLRAKEAAEEAGLRLRGLEKRPDGTLKLEFGEPEADNHNFFAGSPLYKEAS